MPLTYISTDDRTEAIIKDEEVAHQCNQPRTRGLISSTSTLEVGPSGKSIRLNSYLLEAASPFSNRAQFLKKGHVSEQRIVLPDLDYDAMLSIEEFLQSGCTKVTFDNVFAILKVGLKFDLKIIKEDCEQFLTNGLTPQTCLKTFNFATKHGLENLEDCSEDFIRCNFCAVSEQAEFLELEYQDVAWMLFCSEDVVDKETIINANLRWVEFDVPARAKHLPMDKMYASTFEIFCKAFAEGSVLRNCSVSKDMYLKFCETKLFELRRKDLEHLTKPNNNITDEVVHRTPEQPCIILNEAEVSQSELHSRNCNKDCSQNTSVVSNSLKERPATASLDLFHKGDLIYSVAREPIKKKILITRFEAGQKYIEEYNFQTKSTTLLHTPFASRRASALAYYNGIIFDLGGTPIMEHDLASCLASPSVEVYWPGLLFPANTTRLLQPRILFASCICNEYLYVIGGFKNTYNNYEPPGVINYAERYRLGYGCLNAVWQEINNLKSWRSALDVAVLGNKIFAIGGIGTDRYDPSTCPGHDLDSVEVFDTTKSTLVYNWSYVSQMNFARAFMKTAVMNDTIYAVGGSVCTNRADWRQRRALSTVEQYYPERDVWLQCSDMIHKRVRPIVFEDNNLMYAIGGNSADVPSMEVYDTRVDKWMLCEWPMGLRCCNLKLDLNSYVVVSQ